MPTLFIEGPYRIYFTSHDKAEPPHIHVERDGIHLKVWLNNLVVTQNSGFNANEVAKILRIIQNRKIECMEKWNEFFSKK